MTYPPRPASTHQQKWGPFAFDFPNPGTGGAGTAASGLITCATKANLDDNDTVTIGDGLTPAKVYEFDTAGDGASGTNIQVNVSSDTTAATVAARLRTAILANQPALSVTDNSDGTLTVAHKVVGSVGNVTITETVTHASFTVSGMSGGVNPSMNATLTADTTIKLHKFKGRSVHLTRAYLNSPTGLAQDATNYCVYTIKKGSTVIGSFSTLTGADGSLAADTPTEITLSTTADYTRFDDGDQLSLFVDVHGSPTVPAGRVVFEGQEL